MKKLICLLFILISTKIHAETPGFDNITSTDLDNISKEFSANFAHRPLTPASSLGAIFGFEVGIVASVTDAPKIGEITKRENPTESDPLDKLLNAGLMGAVSIPYGITFEAVLLPEQELGDLTISNYSLGAKWTFSSLLPIPVVDLAIRGHYGVTDISYNDTVDAVATEISLDNSTMGFTLLASANLMMIEPYAGVGFVSRDTTLKASGTAQIFDSAFSTASEQSVDGSSFQYFAGVELDLLFIHIAAQYENVFDTSIVSGKLSFAF